MMQQAIRTYIDSESDVLKIDLPQAFRHRHLEVLIIADTPENSLCKENSSVQTVRSTMGILKDSIGDGVVFQNKCRSEWDKND